MIDLDFITADCGHILTAYNLGGKCSRCGKFCCRKCLTTVMDEMLCPTCLKKMLREKDGSVGL